MFSKLFGRRQTPTYKTRVANFWAWFTENAERIYQTIGDEQATDLAGEVTKKMDLLVPDAEWCFGPGPSGEGHSFTFTGAGDIHRQLLTAYWLSRAPDLSGWTFHAVKHRSPDISRAGLELNGLMFKPQEIWLTPYIDGEDEEIDIVVWHPHFARIDEKQRYIAIFIYLDEALGELTVQQHIGEITFSDSALAKAIPFTELASYYDAAAKDHGWETGIPGDTWSSYSRKEQEVDYLRNDIVAGSTAVIPLVREIENGHLDPDPLEDTGAEYVYVVMPREFFPPGEEVRTRGQIEDALVERLEADDLGLLVGGAIGTEHVYIDLLLWDGKASMDAVAAVLKEQGLGAGTSIEYFADDRAKERVVLS